MCLVLYTQPLREATDAESGRRYLLCEYNRDADSYRSPWSNKYDPPLEDAYMPRPELHKLEVTMTSCIWLHMVIAVPSAVRQFVYQLPCTLLLLCSGAVARLMAAKTTVIFTQRLVQPDIPIPHALH